MYMRAKSTQTVSVYENSLGIILGGIGQNMAVK